MNKAMLIGNLCADPELRTTASDVSVCTFRIAVTRPFKRDETDFLPVVAWRVLAENCAKFLSKGKKVGVCGHIQTRTYDDKNGVRRYVTEIIADDIEFLTPKGDVREVDDIPTQDEFEPLDDSSMPF